MIIPAFCRRCGAVFSSGISLASGSTDITLIGNTAGPCPRCGGIGDTLEGTIEVIGDTLTLLSGPDISRARLLHLLDLANQAGQSRARPEETLDEVERLAPEIAPFVQQLRENQVSALSLLVALLMFALSPQAERAADGVAWVINYAIQHSFVR